MENSEKTVLAVQPAQDGAAKHDGLLHIDKDFIATLPLLQYTGKIVLIEDEETAREAVKKLLSEKILGFDTETRPSFTRGNAYLTSLVQLCGENCAYLFRLDFCGGVPVLFPIFENRRILKVGVAVKEDVRHLKMRAPFDDAGFVDASNYTRKVKIENTGLRALCAYFLGGRISKAAQVSNWAARKLTEQQIVYAATDAWTSRLLFLKLQERGIAPKKISQKTLFAPEKDSEKSAEKSREAGEKAPSKNFARAGDKRGNGIVAGEKDRASAGKRPRGGYRRGYRPRRRNNPAATTTPPRAGA